MWLIKHIFEQVKSWSIFWKLLLLLCWVLSGVSGYFVGRFFNLE